MGRRPQTEFETAAVPGEPRGLPWPLKHAVRVFLSASIDGMGRCTRVGLYNYKSRYYNPEVGRFLTQDTYRGNPWQPWTQNLYAYVGNNPVNWIDPTGNASAKIDESGGDCAGCGTSGEDASSSHTAPVRNDSLVAYGMDAAQPGMTQKERQLAVCREAALTDPTFYSNAINDMGCKVVLALNGSDKDREFLLAGLAAASFITLGGIKVEPGMKREDLKQSLINAGYQANGATVVTSSQLELREQAHHDLSP